MLSVEPKSGGLDFMLKSYNIISGKPITSLQHLSECLQGVRPHSRIVQRKTNKIYFGEVAHYIAQIVKFTELLSHFKL